MIGNATIAARLSEFEWGKVVCLLEQHGYDGISCAITEQLEEYEQKGGDDESA